MHQHKPFLRVLSGNRIDPPPIWIMRQAGRYLPEYRKVRTQAGDFLSLCYNPELAAEVTLQPIRRFGFDAAILFADILLVPHALGQDLKFEPSTGPILSPISSKQDIDALNSVDAIHEKLSPICETIRLTKAELPPNTAMLGFAGAPWTTVTYMIAGRGSLGRTPAHQFLEQQPETFERLIELIVKATIEYLSSQINAGAEAVKLFDTWAGSLNADGFNKYVLQPNIKIITEIKRRHPNIPIIAFPRQIGAQINTFANNSEVDCVALDQSIDPIWLNNSTKKKFCVQGNLDPKFLLMDGNNLEFEAGKILNAFADRPHIFNLGHGITPDAKIMNVERLVNTIRSWKRQSP